MPKMHRTGAAFTLLELIVVMAIMGLLASLAIPNYSRVTERARVTRAIGDVRALGQELTEYNLANGAFPAGLADIGRGGFLDPWGNPYQYVVIAGTGRGGLRKDRFLVPINSDFDLYSMGRDGRTQAQFNGKKARDDIVRANNGLFCDLVEKH